MPTFGRDFLTRKSRLILLALLIVMAARIVSTYTVFNGTFDEGYHLMAGMEMYQNGKYQYRTENPPLVSMILAALPYASGVRARWDIDYIQQLLESPPLAGVLMPRRRISCSSRSLSPALRDTDSPK